ncbi:putative O-fucosyltransferase, plant [Sesbania bispinosa]|nr:putative O-fucosyltransferase, plant [Sesbania bispinosa]
MMNPLKPRERPSGLICGQNTAFESSVKLFPLILIATMKLQLLDQLNHSQKSAFAVVFVILLPPFFPHLFHPLGRASPSMFSVRVECSEAYARGLLEGALQRQTSVELQTSLWSPLAFQGWKPCIESPKSPSLPEKSRGYIQVFLDGGLNQQKMGVYIFDVDHFIDVLHDEVSIVKELPSDYSWSTREYYATGIRATRIKTAPVHATADWYIENVLPVLQSYGIAAIAPFSHRLTFNNLPLDIQRLRCKDMAAHSACDFGGGKAERLALAKYRQVIWQGRVLNSQFTDEELRNQGRCPLTPEEIGLLLAALGFNNRTRLYLASHKVYGGEARLATLSKLFPFMEDKKSLASAEDLAKVKGKASLLAAVDYYVSMHR